MSTPRILVACEYSGLVRDAFAARGWDAWSCDFEPTERPSEKHVQGDVIPLLEQDWDLLIAHPPCTYLSNSGAGHMYLGKTKEDKAALGYTINQLRWANMEAGAAFFRIFLNTRVPHVAVENPVMHGWGIERVGGKATQFVQPYHFGHLETKATGLRLLGLPPLVPTDDVEAAMRLLPKKDTHKVHRASPGKNRWKDRSRTYPAIAQAMADQWGAYVEAELALEVAA
jgi:hypothetical protein